MKPAQPTCTRCHRAPRSSCSIAFCPSRRQVTAVASGTPAGVSTETGLRAFDPARLSRGEK